MSIRPRPRPLPPAPPEALSRVQQELRQSWWQTTLVMSLPLVVAVLLGYVVVVQVANGDLLAVLFPGVIVVGAAAMFLRVAGHALRTNRAEQAMSESGRRQAVYVRGLSGTHRIAAAQHPDGFAVLDGLWRSAQGEVVDVRVVGMHRTMSGTRDMLEVDVRMAPARMVTARLTLPRDRHPSVGDPVRVLEDPHHPRAVVDLRPGVSGT